MKLKYFLPFLVLIVLTNCSDDIQILEEKIKFQAEKNNNEMSKVEIKKAALYLSAWSKADFFQEAIDEFLDEDIANPPPQDSILFTGSSSIRFWKTLQEDMKPLVTLNRGFGGAHIAHVNYHFEDVVKKYNPKGIVFFCGTNDIAALKGPKETLSDLNIFINKVKSNLPNVPIFIIGIKPTTAREYLRDEEIQYNQAISDLSEEDNLVSYIDIWEAMLNEDGQPNSNLFVEDNLHINADGYKIWTSIVRKELSNYFDL